MTDSLAIQYQAYLGLKQTQFKKIVHDDALVAIVYQLTDPHGNQSILKICPRTPDYLREAYFLKHFETQLPVPKIISLIPPESGLHAAILMEYIPGTILKTEDFTPSLAEEAGAILARIHLNRTTGYGDLTQAQDLQQDPGASFNLKLEEAFTECTGHLPNALLAQCRHYYHAHLNLLASTDGPCITHRDFRPGNLLAKNNQLTGIIDWSSARASFAEEDFCSMEHGVWAFDSRSKQYFLDGYARIRPLPNYQRIMPLLQLSKAMATIGFLVKQGTWNKQNSKLYQLNREFIDRFEFN